MEWLKNTGLKRAFFLLSALSMAAALLLIGMVFMISAKITSGYPTGGIMITADGVVKELDNPTREQMLVLQVIGWIEFLSCILVPVGCLGIASLLFYRYKLKAPIAVLQMGTERIREHDLDFSLPEVSRDELGQVCEAFETMRGELLKTNQQLWRHAEERKRLNAVFSHDLRNPVTVLKGTVKLMRQGTADGQALERMETYVLRIERYVEAMSSIQRMEQIPVQKKRVELHILQKEVEETVRLLAPDVNAVLTVDSIEAGDAAGTEYDIFGDAALLGVRDLETDSESFESGQVYMKESVLVDHGLFLTVAENLIGNAARYASSRIRVDLSVCEGIPFYDKAKGGGNIQQNHVKQEMFLMLTVLDDGKGYPLRLVQDGPRPFGRMEEDEDHFGMGLYSSQMLCRKHGGELFLENEKAGGARVTAAFQI